MSGNVSPLSSAAPVGRRLLTRSAIIAGVVAVGWWVVSLNRISVQISSPGNGESLVVELPDPEPLIVTISPSRRLDGTEVLIDGRRVAHPAGDEPGQLVVALDQLEPGIHQIEIRVLRPTWLTESVEIEVKVVASTTRR